MVAVMLATETCSLEKVSQCLMIIPVRINSAFLFLCKRKRIMMAFKLTIANRPYAV